MELPKLYGRRKGRPLHKRKAGLIDDLLPRLRIDLAEGARIDPSSLFDEPKISFEMEIGFGSGDHLAAQAERASTTGFIGCEPFLNGIANLLGQIDEKKLSNIRIFPDDARKVLDALPEASLSRAFLLFPDPWPKKKHAERRFIGKENLDRLARALKSGGELRLATDMDFLAEWMKDHTDAHPAFTPIYAGREPPADWVPTRYEQKGRAAGRIPYYFCYKRA
jgi:tRNA (guanine-N7-)-methyltransferase